MRLSGWLALPVALVLTTAATAQTPSIEDLQRLHRGESLTDEPPRAVQPASPRSNPIPPPMQPAPPSGAAASTTTLWGAIAFTADGSYSTAWKYKSKSEAEAYVATKCSAFGRGECKVIGFVGTLCAGLASYNGSHSGRRYRLAFTGGGPTASEAQSAAMNRCNADSRTRNRCQLRTVVCGDGR